MYPGRGAGVGLSISGGGGGGGVNRRRRRFARTLVERMRGERLYGDHMHGGAQVVAGDFGSQRSGF